MWARLRDGLMALSAEDRPAEDVEALIAMRDELDRRGVRKPVEINFEKYLTD